MNNNISLKIVKSLILPKAGSHKGQNGRVLVIAGSKKYHGALLYAITTASRIVDLIYIYTDKENYLAVKKLKSQTAEFITINKLPKPLEYDCVLIGPGLGISSRTKKLVTAILKSKSKAVLDADALKILDKPLLNLLHRNCILTPHTREFQKTFRLSPTPKNAGATSKKYHCTILLKNRVDIIGLANGKIYFNHTGNAGMTKGGTGDVLAGLVAALFCKNAIFPSAAAGAYVCGRAGDDLNKKVGTFYNAEDLSRQIPSTLAAMLK